MEELCKACAAGPDGFEGHGAMLAQALGDMGMEFRCGDCQALWVRAISGLSQFRWVHRVRPPPEAGVALPPLSGGGPGP
jgi:hypothetical protein